MKPLVSIIIPNFNRANLIGETLDSLLAQTYSNWECIIVDDGSTDNSLNVIQQYCNKDNRFKLYYRPNNRIKGASCCRNIGLENSKGEFIQFLDSDDLISKNKLASQIILLKEQDSNCIATCKWGRFKDIKDLKSNFKHYYNSYNNFNSGINLLQSFGENNEFFPSSVYLISKQLISLSGKWNENISNNDDGEFFTRVILKALRVIYVEKSEVYYRDNKINKLSEFNSYSKCLSAINSWKLIENHIFRVTNFKKSLYVENAKEYIYSKLKKDYEYLIIENNEFFKHQIKKYSFFNRLKRKLF